jgi:hypothetical protein
MAHDFRKEFELREKLAEKGKAQREDKRAREAWDWRRRQSLSPREKFNSIRPTGSRDSWSCDEWPSFDGSVLVREYETREDAPPAVPHESRRRLNSIS